MTAALYTPELLNEVNHTHRGIGAVGPRALVPRVVQNMGALLTAPTILDFGAGPQAYHTQGLRMLGFNATAWDVGGNFVEGVHDPHALERTYDIVMASNVLNVQPNLAILHAVIRELFHLVAPGGVLVCNYPESPRRIPVKRAAIKELLESRFRYVEDIAGYPGVLACYKRRYKEEVCNDG